MVGAAKNKFRNLKTSVPPVYYNQARIEALEATCERGTLANLQWAFLLTPYSVETLSIAWRLCYDQKTKNAYAKAVWLQEQAPNDIDIYFGWPIDYDLDAPPLTCADFMHMR